jgi:hypothetical protein
MPTPQETSDDSGHGLTKSVWTDADFAMMGWHDCNVVALGVVQDDEDDFAARLLIDLDYITRWAGGGTPGAAFTFWVAPATLIFHGVYELEGTLKQGHAFPETLEVGGITRESVDDRLRYDRWALEGDISLTWRASGFRQIIRQEPLHVPRQSLTLNERHGVSFSEDSFDGAASSLAVTHALNPPVVQRIRRSGAAPPE